MKAACRTLPLLVGHGADDVLVWRRGAAFTARELVRLARAAAQAMPAHRYYINGCERRSTFLIAFLAALQREATTLLPMTRSDAVLAQVTREYPDQVTVTDAMVEEWVATAIAATTARDAAGRDHDLPADHVAAIVFTSGSTGTPQGHVKTWSTLLGTAELARERFLDGLGRCNLVTTVPSQHMYGLETSIMLTLGGGCAVSDTRPFFPRDVAEELAAVPEPRVLVTTPAHLRACVVAHVEFPPLALIVSATAPLSADLAADMEALAGAPVQEIYGCTEAGSMASRRTVEGDLWRPYRDSRIEIADGNASFVGRHLPAAVPLQDVIEPADGDRFRLVGRSDDLVKIAGKRASLADLTQQLLSVAGVVDAVMFMPGDDGRCAALVVAPTRTREQVMAALATRIDAAFLPRPLKLVERLPRNETGKLPRAVLLAALEDNASRPNAGTASGGASAVKRGPGAPAFAAGPFVVEPDDPCFDGHFPGNPLVPGVVILDIAAHGLDQAVDAASGRGESTASRAKVVGLVQAKFSAPLRPGEPLAIEFQPCADERTIAFRCSSAGRSIADGLFEIQVTGTR